MKQLLWGALLLFGVSLAANAATINNSETLSNLTASTGSSLSFEIAVPSGASNLSIAIAGGTGDADLYVRYGSTPTDSRYDCRPYLTGNAETCEFATPSVGTYYILIDAYAGFSGVSLSASYDAAGGTTGDTLLSNGESVANLSGNAGTALDYTIDVPAGASNLVIAMSGGTGDADLYVRYGSTPSSSRYDCRPYLNGNNETCTIASPQVGSYYIRIVGYSAFSGVTLSVAYQGTTGGGGGGSGFVDFDTYYADAIGKSGTALRSALQEAAARYQSHMSYSEVWQALKYTDEDPDNSNNVILIYTGRSQAKTFNSSGNNDPDAWNREHTWPKSHGFPDSGDWAYTDIHHLRPADASVNSTRSNKDFDEGGSAISEAPGNYTDSDSFEPRDAVKGDIARMMFYMAVRYNGNDSTGTEDLQLVNDTGTSGSFLGKVCTLLQWNSQDPLNSQEIARHARIVERQGNRNPFVDNPAWADDIWGSGCQ